MQFNAHTHFRTGLSVEVIHAETDFDMLGYFSAGVHPWKADLFRQKKAEIEHTAIHPFCLAIGEIGLDKIKGPDFGTQKEAFIQQIALAEQLKLPAIIHCVKAWNELQAIKRAVNPTQTWVFHGLAKANLVEPILEEGFVISLGTAILKNETLQKAVVRMPIEHFLCETDDANCPIDTIYRKISELKRIPLPDLENQLEKNFKRVFTKWKIGLSEQNS